MARRNGTGNSGGNTGRFVAGYDPRRGHGKKGRSGRPRDEFRQAMRDLVSSEEVIGWMERMLQTEVPLEIARAQPELAIRLAELKLKVLAFAADRGYGKAWEVEPDEATEERELRFLTDEELVERMQLLAMRGEPRNAPK